MVVLIDDEPLEGGVELFELATLGWVHWHNMARLHGYLRDVPPAEYEAAFYDALRLDQPLVETQ